MLKIKLNASDVRPIAVFVRRENPGIALVSSSSLGLCRGIDNGGWRSHY